MTTTTPTAADSAPVIECRGLRKVYRIGFWMNQRVEALVNLDLTVRRGEVFGFLGPNGAGKSTTLKILNNLIRPTAGEARLFGHPPGHPAATRRIGFLPENPVFYDNLTGRELLAYYAELVHVDRRERKARIARLLDQVGLTRAADYQVRRYSKGMVERIGIAQALLQDPDLVMLDEPTSGLDPIGRREVRELILDLRARGKTVFFSTHIIPDVEMVCDRVGMVIGGKLAAIGTVRELMGSEVRTVEVTVAGVPDEVLRGAAAEAKIEKVATQQTVTLASEDAVEPLLRAVLQAGGRVVQVQPARSSLEDLFLKESRHSKTSPAPER